MAVTFTVPDACASTGPSGVVANTAPSCVTTSTALLYRPGVVTLTVVAMEEAVAVDGTGIEGPLNVTVVVEPTAGGVIVAENRASPKSCADAETRYAPAPSVGVTMLRFSV